MVRELQPLHPADAQQSRARHSVFTNCVRERSRLNLRMQRVATSPRMDRVRNTPSTDSQGAVMTALSR
jgi:hypothetical protein